MNISPESTPRGGNGKRLAPFTAAICTDTLAEWKKNFASMTDSTKEVAVMANEQNLRPFTSDQSREAAVKNGRKGGKATARKKRERKTFREGLLLLLNEPLKDKDGNTTDKTTQDAIIAGLVKRAVSGDTRAFEMIRDTVGEKPAQDVKVTTGDFSALDEAFKGLGQR